MIRKIVDDIILLHQVISIACIGFPAQIQKTREVTLVSHVPLQNAHRQYLEKKRPLQLLLKKIEKAIGGILHLFYLIGTNQISSPPRNQMVTTQPFLLVHNVALDGCHHLVEHRNTSVLLHDSDKTAIIGASTLLPPLVSSLQYLSVLVTTEPCLEPQPHSPQKNSDLFLIEMGGFQGGSVRSQT